MKEPDFTAGLDDVPEHLRQSITDLNRDVWRRAVDNVASEASIHDDWGDINAALADPESDGYNYFVMGLWAGMTAPNMVYLDKGLIRPD